MRPWTISGAAGRGRLVIVAFAETDLQQTPNDRASPVRP